MQYGKYYKVAPDQLEGILLKLILRYLNHQYCIGLIKCQNL